MTDHRVTDLSYGHLGNASYDTDGNQWTFSNTKDEGELPSRCCIAPANNFVDQRIQQLLPLTERIPPSFQNAPKKDGIPSQIAKSQLKWLVKNRPETFPGNAITSVLAKAHDAGRAEPSRSGCLLTVGRAVDVDRVSMSRRPRIICTPCGGAGHILQLIRPSTERRGWGKHSVAKLALLALESSERGYWVGTGGAIRQIESADDENESGTWLAVRQDTIITIFRPIYGKLHISAGPPTGLRTTNTSSRLNPNPVATLATERITTEDYMDASFNPWYARQFAVVNARGYWSIWDLERQDGKGSREQLISGKKGNFEDDYNPNPISNPQPNDHADGWYRILWACNINTIVVCNRRRIAVIDIKSAPFRLPSIEIMTGNGTEWMLDLKRSSQHLNYLFILTTSRIFWVEVIPPGEDGGDQAVSAGIKVKLSYRHFRDPNDETLKLTLANNDPGMDSPTGHQHWLTRILVTAFISSTKDLLVNYYCFKANTDSSGLGTSFQGSFTLASDSGEPENVHKALQTLCVLAAPLTSTLTTNSTGPELQYLAQDVRFFQLWALTTDLGLHSTLFSVFRSRCEEITRPRLHITAPTVKLTQSLRPQGPQFVHDSFIVADGIDDEPSLGHEYAFRGNDAHSVTDRNRDDPRFRLNWKAIFQHVFGLSNVQIETVDDDVESQEEGEKRLKECLARASSHIREGISGEKLTRSTLYVIFFLIFFSFLSSSGPGLSTLNRHEISGISDPSGDIEPANSVLREFLGALRGQVQSPEESSAFEFVLSDLKACPSIQFPLDQAYNFPDPLIIYDQLIDNWMASLPLDVAYRARLSKFNIIRQATVELFLSSFAVSPRNKATDVNFAPIQSDEIDFTLPEQDKDYGTTRESSPVNFPSQVVSFPRREPHFSLPTPAQTPSLYSHATGTSASELKEDPAISRLRQYAVSIKPKPDFGKSPILSQWPSSPGSDPAKYSWEARQKASDRDPAADQSEKRNRKEQARRHRRTERFLNQDDTRMAEASSQPIVVPSGSQPEVTHNGFSSQTVEDIPMTQPDRGAFGSRSIQKSKKKPKKHRTAGF
jgi:RNA polymerase I-specific transcription initiation factor RRN6